MEQATEAVERYVRINITKNTKGYSYETTISLRWTGDIDRDFELDRLNVEADNEARAEIKRRQGLDAEGGDE